MSLFQNSVLNKYLKGLDTEKVKEAYKNFTIHFHNPLFFFYNLFIKAPSPKKNLLNQF